jgi:hypothetical protein
VAPARHWRGAQNATAQVASDMLLDSAQHGGALAGIALWNAAGNSTIDWDGYNVALDRPAYTQAGSALPLPASLLPAVVSREVALALTPNNWWARGGRWGVGGWGGGDTQCVGV